MSVVEICLPNQEVLYRRIGKAHLDELGRVISSTLNLHVSFNRDKFDKGGQQAVAADRRFNGLATITIGQARALHHPDIATDVIHSPGKNSPAHTMVVFLPRDHSASNLADAESKLKGTLAMAMTVLIKPTK